MRIVSAIFGIACLSAGCSRAPDRTELATTARSWTESAALATTLSRDGAVPTAFTRHAIARAADGLATTEDDARQLSDAGRSSELAHAVDDGRRLLPLLDSALAHARRDSASAVAARLHAIATSLAPLTPDGTAR